MITAFMFSVITKRAFVLRNLDNDFKLEDGCVVSVFLRITQ